MRTGNRRLVTRLHRSEAGPLLLLEERASPRFARSLRAESLSAREAEVLLEIEAGKSNRDIAAALCISPSTVKKHFENIFAKLGVQSRTAALARMRSMRDGRATPGLTAPPPTAT